MEQRGTEKQRQDDFTGQIIAACIEVHRHLGPGLLESAYEHCLARELGLRGFRTQRQVAIPLQYKGIDLDCGYRLDLMVEGRLVVEVKTVEQLLPVPLGTVITYLKLLRLPVGLLVNFHVPVLREGLRRLVNPTRDSSGPPFLPVFPSDPTCAGRGEAPAPISGKHPGHRTLLTGGCRRADTRRPMKKELETSRLCVVLLVASTSGTACFRTSLGDSRGLTPDGSAEHLDTPILMRVGDDSSGRASPPAGTFTSVSAGYLFACGLRTDGTIACWGDNSFAEAAPPAP